MKSINLIASIGLCSLLLLVGTGNHLAAQNDHAKQVKPNAQTSIQKTAKKIKSPSKNANAKIRKAENKALNEKNVVWKKRMIEERKKNFPDKPSKSKVYIDEKGNPSGLKRASKPNKGKGNAYGRNKAGKEGRDFGQQRALQAREIAKRTVNQSESTITESQKSVISANQKIKNARAKFEVQKKSGKYTKEQITAKEAKLNAAEKQVQQLERSIKKEQQNLSKYKSVVD